MKEPLDHLYTKVICENRCGGNSDAIYYNRYWPADTTTMAFFQKDALYRYATTKLMQIKGRNIEAHCMLRRPEACMFQVNNVAINIHWNSK